MTAILPALLPALLAFTLLPLQTAPTAPGSFAPLHAYNGAWSVTIPPAKPDALNNRCTELAAYYACEQVLNGKPIALVVFTATDVPKKFHSQVVLPNGNVVGRSDLTVDGPHWTYHSSGTGDSGKPVFYRTENTFTGLDRIHFEQFESTDDKTWTKTRDGDEVRAAQ